MDPVEWLEIFFLLLPEVNGTCLTGVRPVKRWKSGYSVWNVEPCLNKPQNQTNCASKVQCSTQSHTSSGIRFRIKMHRTVVSGGYLPHASHKEVLQRQDYGLVYRQSEMVCFSLIFLQFIIPKKGLGTHQLETLYPHTHPWNTGKTTACYNHVVCSVPATTKNKKKRHSLENGLSFW